MRFRNLQSSFHVADHLDDIPLSVGSALLRKFNEVSHNIVHELHSTDNKPRVM